VVARADNTTDEACIQSLGQSCTKSTAGSLAAWPHIRAKKGATAGKRSLEMQPPGGPRRQFAALQAGPAVGPSSARDEDEEDEARDTASSTILERQPGWRGRGQCCHLSALKAWWNAAPSRPAVERGQAARRELGRTGHTGPQMTATGRAKWLPTVRTLPGRSPPLVPAMRYRLIEMSRPRLPLARARHVVVLPPLASIKKRTGDENADPWSGPSPLPRPRKLL
jgi:hypothetical protein